MKVNKKIPPRKFKVGNGSIELMDAASIELEVNEQVTFISPDEKEYDIVRKEWGYYGTPSINGRLVKFGIKTALVKSPGNLYFIHLVEKEKLTDYINYINRENHIILCWLDEEKTISKLDKTFLNEH